MKFGYYTDPHITHKTKKKRNDIFSETILSKMKDIYAHAAKSKVDAMICGGDLFDVYKVNDFKILLALMKIIYNAPFKTYFVIGNHDVYSNNLDTYIDTTLNFITEISDIFKCDKLIPIIEPIEFDDFVLNGYHAMQKLESAEDVNIVKTDKQQIIVSHHYIHDKESKFQLLSSELFDNENVDLYLVGHLHSGFPYHKLEHTAFYNPGALGRISAHCRDRVVKYGIFETTPTSIELIEEYEPTQLKGSELFIEEDIKDDDYYQVEVDGDDIIEDFEELKKQSIDIFHLLELSKEHYEIKPEIVNYISGFRK